MPVRDSSVPAVPDRGLGEEVVFPGVDLGAVRRGGLPVAPHGRHVELGERVDDRRGRLLDLGGGRVLVPGQGQLVDADLTAHVRCDLRWAEQRAVGERGQHVPRQKYPSRW